MKLRSLLIVVVTLIVGSNASLAAELRGVVTGLIGTSVIITLDADARPEVGDQVDISFVTVDDEIPVGTWEVSEIDGDVVIATVVAADGDATLDMIAVIHTGDDDPPTSDTVATANAVPAATPTTNVATVQQTQESAAIETSATSGPSTRTQTMVLQATLLSNRQVSDDNPQRFGIEYATEVRPFLSLFEMSEPKGSLVIGVTMGSPAEAAGVRAGDMIVAVGDRAVEEPTALARMIEETPSSIPVGFKILRINDHGDGLHDLLLAKVAENDTVALTAMAELQRVGFNGPASPGIAFDLFSRAAEQGDGFAAYRLAGLYAEGRGTDTNLVSASRWYRTALERGEDAAYLEIGYLLWSNRYWVDGRRLGDDKEAVRYFRAAAERGWFGSYFYLGAAYDIGRGVEINYTEAARWYRRSIEATGSSGAMTNLARLLMNGSGDITRDYAEARRLLERAVDHEVAVAYRLLGVIYRDGKSVTKDSARAVELFRRGAEGGDVSAMFFAGLLLTDSNAQSDKKEAVDWYRKAAAEGHPGANYALAFVLVNGEGTARDYDGAAHYLFQAMWRGSEVAISEMKENSTAWPRHVLRAIQERLKRRGYYQGKIDGRFGAQTSRAIDKLVAAGR